MPLTLTFAALAIAATLSAPAPGRNAPRPRPAAPAAATPAELDVSTFPAAQQANFALVQDKCTKCHALAVALRAPPTPSVWSRHQKRSGSAVRPEQARDILKFLEFFAARRAASGR
jgi:cytochrome c5